MSYEKFSSDNAAMPLIDHQVGTMSWVKSIPFDEMKRNALMLAEKVVVAGVNVSSRSSSHSLRNGQ